MLYHGGHASGAIACRGRVPCCESCLCSFFYRNVPSKVILLAFGRSSGQQKALLLALSIRDGERRAAIFFF